MRTEGSDQVIFLKSEERVIFLDRSTDSAIVLLFKRELQFPECPITLLPMEQPCPIDADIGWLGFPAIEPNTLCFFAGTISARQADLKAYLIDGVAINGVTIAHVDIVSLSRPPVNTFRWRENSDFATVPSA